MSNKTFLAGLPNALTLANLFCGLVVATAILTGAVELHSMWVVYGVFGCFLFDFLDGFVARLLRVHSELGKQLDSLADMVSFGVVPGVMVFAMLLHGHDLTTMGTASAAQMGFRGALFGFVIPVFSALRLAKFNLDTRQTDHFIGLPTPANTGIVLGLWVAGDSYFGAYLPLALYLIAPVLSLLLIAELPMISNKFRGSSWTGNELRYLLLFALVIGLLVWGGYAFAPLGLLYILISVAIWLRGRGSMAA